MMSNARVERNQDATVYVGNLAPDVEEDILYELMVQVAPVAHIKLPKDKISKSHQGFAFIEFKSPKDVDYVTKIMNGVSLYGRNLKINKAKNEDTTQLLDVGATLYLGNLDKLIDENFLMETFKNFGNFVKLPMIVRDNSTRESKGYGFLHFDSFENSDKVLSQMNGQYLMNKPVKIDYALKKDAKHGERHGDPVERLLAANAKANNLLNANELKKQRQKEEQFAEAERERARQEALDAEQLKQKQDTYDRRRNNNGANSSNRGSGGRGRGRGGRGGRGGYNNYHGDSPYQVA